MNKLTFYRTQKGVSQQTVADYLGISRQAYSNYEAGNREASYETLLQLAEYFETSVDAILGREAISSVAPSDDDIKFALFGGDGIITDEMYEEVKQFAKFIKERENRENE